jgi:hypothetical protein
MRNIITALLISFSCFGQGNLIVREIFGGKKTALVYNGNFGKLPASPIPTALPEPAFTTYNGYTREAQAGAGLYSNSNGIR